MRYCFSVDFTKKIIRFSDEKESFLNFCSYYDSYYYIKKGFRFKDLSGVLPVYNYEDARELINFSDEKQNILGWSIVTDKVLSINDSYQLAWVNHRKDYLLLRKYGTIGVFHYTDKPEELILNGFKFEYTNPTGGSFGRGMYFFTENKGKCSKSLLQGTYTGEYFICVYGNDSSQVGEGFINKGYENIKFKQIY